MEANRLGVGNREKFTETIKKGKGWLSNYCDSGKRRDSKKKGGEEKKYALQLPHHD